LTHSKFFYILYSPAIGSLSLDPSPHMKNLTHAYRYQ